MSAPAVNGIRRIAEVTAIAEILGRVVDAPTRGSVTPGVHGGDDIGPTRLTGVSGVPIPRTEDGKPPQRILHAVAVDQQVALLDRARVAVHGLIERWLKGRKQALEVFASRGRSEIGDHGVGECD